MDQQKARKDAFTSHSVDQKRRTYASCILSVKLSSTSVISYVLKAVHMIKQAYART